MLNRIAKITKAPKTIKRFSQSRILDSAFCCWAVSSVADKIQDNSHFLDFQNIYVDVSIFSKHDNRTGIQRVVREVIFQLISDNDIKTRLKFVAATKGAFYRQVDYQLIGDEIKFQPLNTKTPQVSLGKGDVFIGLDFCPHIVPLHLFAFMRAKKRGARFFWVLYDLLPIQHPDWFTSNIRQTFEPWLRTILLLSDSVLCISKVVEKHAQVYANRIGLKCNLTTIQLGHGFRKTSQQLISDSTGAIIQDRFSKTDFVLMVGTLEPRKGHADIVSAFQRIWQDGLSDTALVIVGQKGWGVDELIQSIRLPFFHNRIFWISSVNDALLEFLYQKSLGVIIASHDEGYGLPLVEAVAYNKHVFARNIEVFKEVANGYENIDYFEANNQNLFSSLEDWLTKKIKTLNIQSSAHGYQSKSWEDTLSDIKHAIGI